VNEIWVPDYWILPRFLNRIERNWYPNDLPPCPPNKRVIILIIIKKCSPFWLENYEQNKRLPVVETIKNTWSDWIMFNRYCKLFFKTQKLTANFSISYCPSVTLSREKVKLNFPSLISSFGKPERHFHLKLIVAYFQQFGL
jgi:hypothetical protein